MTILDNGKRPTMSTQPQIEPSFLPDQAHADRPARRAGRKCAFCPFRSDTTRVSDHEQQCMGNPNRVPFEHECGFCPETFPTKQGAAAHRGRMHRSDDPRLVRDRERKRAGRQQQNADNGGETSRLDQAGRDDLLAILAAYLPDGINPQDAGVAIQWADSTHALITNLRANRIS